MKKEYEKMSPVDFLAEFLARRLFERNEEGIDYLRFDFRPIFECKSDVVLAVDGSVVNQCIPCFFVEFC